MSLASQFRASLEAKIANLKAENAALASERSALRQALQKAEAEARSQVRDTDSRLDTLLQTRLASEMAQFMKRTGIARDEADVAGDAATTPARIAAAIAACPDSSLAAWRACLNLLAGARAFDATGHATLAAALRARYAALHEAGAPRGFKDGDDDPSKPRSILRRALGGEIPAILLIDAHNALFAMQCRYRLPTEHRWPTAQARDWLVRDIAALLADAPNVRAYIVFDGPQRSETPASANVQTIYSGGTGEHRADGVLIDQARFLESAGAENVLIFTNDGGLAGAASRHGARAISPIALLPLL